MRQLLLHQHDLSYELTPGTTIDARYRVIRTIGRGGNALVYEVEHVLTGRRLALKSLVDAAGLGRLEQEARASSLLKNAHVARVTDMGTSGPAGPYLVMELLDGIGLRELLDGIGELPRALAVNIALQICECLAEAHALGIIHRDLKPENVFLCQSVWAGQYDAKVLDFGIVKIAAGSALASGTETRGGSTVGTPYYMSLEQLRSSATVDGRSDVYALGVVLYECLTGHKPYEADTIGDLVYALCSGPPPALEELRLDLPLDLCDVVMSALSVHREARPAGMVELATALAPHGDAVFSMWLRNAEARAARAAFASDDPTSDRLVDARAPAASGPRLVASVSAPAPHCAPVRLVLPYAQQAPAIALGHLTAANTVTTLHSGPPKPPTEASPRAIPTSRAWIAAAALLLVALGAVLSALFR